MTKIVKRKFFKKKNEIFSYLAGPPFTDGLPGLGGDLLLTDWAEVFYAVSSRPYTGKCFEKLCRI